MLTSPSGKNYIGQTRDFEHRMYMHRRHVSNHLIGRAIQKYGFDSFEVIKLHEHVPFHDLNWLERHCIALYDTYLNGYNLTPGGDANPTDNPETRQKMSEIALDKVRRGEHVSQTDEFKTAMSKRLKDLGRQGLHQSQTEEFKQYMSDLLTERGERGELPQQTTEWREYQSALKTERGERGELPQQQDEWKADVSEKMKKIWQDPEYRLSHAKGTLEHLKRNKGYTYLFDDEEMLRHVKVEEDEEE